MPRLDVEQLRVEPILVVAVDNVAIPEGRFSNVAPGVIGRKAEKDINTVGSLSCASDSRTIGQKSLFLAAEYGSQTAEVTLQAPQAISQEAEAIIKEVGAHCLGVKVSARAIQNGSWGTIVGRIESRGAFAYADASLSGSVPHMKDAGAQIFSTGASVVGAELLGASGASLAALAEVRDQAVSTQRERGYSRHSLLFGSLPDSSFVDDDFERLNMKRPDLIRAMLTLALDYRLDGVKCTAADLPLVREFAGRSLFVAVESIRLSQDSPDDHPETLTPDEAAELADLIIVGRPITSSENPAEQIKQYHAAMDRGWYRNWAAELPARA